MRETTERALDVAQSNGATYADIRIVRRENQNITVKNGIVQTLSLDDDFGFGVRVIADGAWGFASSNRLTEDEIDRISAQAVAIAKASAMANKDEVSIGPPEVHVDTYKTPVEIDPFAVSLEDKIDVLIAADKEARAVKGLALAQGSMGFLRETKTFASSEGSFIEQTLIESGLGITVRAVADGEMQQRSYPNSFGRHQGTGGYEIINKWDLPGNARQVAEEAVALLSAPQCPSKTTTIILD
ncbi:TldD/PmbA family protein, partial [Candidatus Bipolaricaulota bacterium]|nr:TldD/PmbA family protein [Candidatus Bipolaricaulota bacterium]